MARYGWGEIGGQPSGRLCGACRQLLYPGGRHSNLACPHVRRSLSSSQRHEWGGHLHRCLSLPRLPTCHAWACPRAMPRRADPQRIHEARRAAVRNNLVGSGMSLETAERFCDAWELEATGRGLPRDREYWEVGEAWIAAERAARRPGLGIGRSMAGGGPALPLATPRCQRSPGPPKLSTPNREVPRRPKPPGHQVGVVQRPRPTRPPY